MIPILKSSKLEYKEQNLSEGDVVEFPRNAVGGRFGVVTGGFGMYTFTSGSKIFGVFGATAQNAVENYVQYLQLDIETKAKFDPSGFTRRQPCKVVGHINTKTGKIEKTLQT